MNHQTIGYRVSSFEHEDRVIKLSTGVISELDLDLSKPVSLRFGCLQTSVSVMPISPKPLPDRAEMKISKQAAEELRMPENIQVSIKPTSTQELRLGPVIGILTFRHVEANKSFNFYLNYHVMLKSGLLYVFSIHGINTATKTIKGYYFDNSKKIWVQAILPYPDVVFDRCYPNAYRAHNKLEKVIGRGKIFNKKTLISKLDFYNALSENLLLSNHLPETRPCIGTPDLEYFLDKYREIFIKPLNGMKGIGIITVSLEENELKCRYMGKGEAVEKKVANSNQIFDVLREFGHPKRRYIIQNAIPRMDYQGRPFCFRVMVCKNDKGQWLVPAIFPKAATVNSFLTNHASGAGFVSLKNLFKEIEGRLGCTKTEFLNLLIELGIKTAEVLNKKYGPLGELGLDMVVDQSGRPWLIEANGNPGIVPNSHMVEFPNWIYQGFNLPISYAIHLSGFNND